MTDQNFFAQMQIGIPQISPPTGPVAREKPRPDMSLMRQAMGLPPEPEASLSPLLTQITSNQPAAQSADQEYRHG
ncbi:hypothetical protein I5T99_12615 [Stenotrophomonas maltophilia]|nr:hypothetical protein [Stenotrophomonas maltophilia]